MSFSKQFFSGVLLFILLGISSSPVFAAPGDPLTDATGSASSTPVVTPVTVPTPIVMPPIPQVVASSSSTTTVPSLSPTIVATTTDATTTENIVSNDDVATSTPPVVIIPDETSTTTATTTKTTGTATLTVRDGSLVAWSGTITFPIGTSTTDVLPTNSSTTVPVLNQSLLGALVNLEKSESDFTISDLPYYQSFGEFLINCITIPAADNSPACYNWQYQVDGNYPFVGVDQYVLQDGDSVYLYFGSPRQVTLSSNNVTTDESFVATAESYEPATGEYVPAPGYVIGVTQPDPNNPYSPTEIATSTADSNGTATFLIPTAGSYGVGLQADGYFPVTPLTVASSTDQGGGGNGGGGEGGGGGGGGGGTSNTQSAFSFLTSKQESNGSFDSSIITDWSALALALPDAPSSARLNLASYLRSTSVPLSLPTDYERHALALLALGINPYTGSPSDVITPIVEAFDGTAIGDHGLINGDIFGLLVLPHAGYTSNDTIIEKTAAYVVQQQSSNGSWSSSVDLTAAGIQALLPFSSLPGVSSAIGKAENYLHTSQQTDGGFGNADSTSWVLNALAAKGESPSSWTAGSSTPLTYLDAQQQSDGGINQESVNADSRTWSTAYALTAFEGRSWSSLLGNFSNPGGTTNTGGDSSTTTASTTVTLIATTTPPLVITATTTPLVIPPPIVPSIVPVFTPRYKTLTTLPVAPKISTATNATSAPFTNLAAAATAPAAYSLWEMIAHFFESVGSFFGHLF